jgi:hypothetical protein
MRSKRRLEKITYRGFVLYTRYYIRVNKLRYMRWTDNVACMGEKRNAYFW